MLRRSVTLASLAILFAGTASAATVKFHTTMTPAAEVPPTTSKGSGEATVSLDTATHEITYDVTFKGFASDVVAAHIHGPAEPGKNAGVVVAFPKSPTSPIHGTATLTPEQEQQLTAGLYYVNIHSKNFPSGAIRGQLTK
jgi:Cu/Zn superoxide dismutase